MDKYGKEERNFKRKYIRNGASVITLSEPTDPYTNTTQKHLVSEIKAKVIVI